jgi:phage N-6-adenine-methyltransferase
VSLVGFKAKNHRQQVNKRGPFENVDDRRTPRDLFDPLNEEFNFTLDAAASKENKLCSVYYDKRVSGLDNSWFTYNVWCNPPYSDIRSWVAKATSEIAKVNSVTGRAYGPPVVVMLLPANRTEQGWWQDLIEPGRRAGDLEVRFLRGRLRFDVPSDTYSDPRGNRPPFGCCLVIWTTT